METEDLGNKYALSALKKRRGQIAGELIELKRQVAWRQSQLDHLDVTLRLFDPDIEPRKLPVSRPRKRFKLFAQGELSRLVIDALRRAGKPLGTHAVVTALLKAGGHDESARPALGPRVRGNLAYQEKRGTVAKAGHWQSVVWSLKQ